MEVLWGFLFVFKADSNHSNERQISLKNKEFTEKNSAEKHFLKHSGGSLLPKVTIQSTGKPYC